MKAQTIEYSNLCTGGAFYVHYIELLISKLFRRAVWVGEGGVQICNVTLRGGGGGGYWGPFKGPPLLIANQIDLAHHKKFLTPG